MSNEHERFYKTVPMVGTIPENSSGGGGTGLQTAGIRAGVAACTDRIGGAGVVMHSVIVDAQSDALREALVDLLHAVCGKTGFAQAVRRDSGRIYPWPALDLAEAKARAALEQSK